MVTQIVWREITTVFKGRVVRGSYTVEDGTVKVRTEHGEKTTQLRGTMRFGQPGVCCASWQRKEKRRERRQKVLAMFTAILRALILAAQFGR